MILLAMWACGSAEPSSAPADTAAVPVDLSTQLTGLGPSAVGYREEEVDYLEPGTGAERTLRLALWYPTDATEGQEVRYQGLFEAPGVLGAVAPSPGAHPVVVFSHGHQGFAENSSFLAVHLASHGWVVAAPDHTGNTTFDGPGRTTEIYFQRAHDVGAVLDVLPERIPSADLERVVAVGHSFGGYTMYGLSGAVYDIDALIVACESGAGPSAFCSTMSPDYATIFRNGLADPRVDAIVAMAAGDFELFGAPGVAAIEVPVLHMTGGLDPGADNEPYWDAMDGPDALRVHLPAAGHQSFTDFSGILEDVEGLLEPEEGFRAIRAYVLAFARFHTGDVAVAPVLDGTMRVSEAVELSTR